MKRYFTYVLISVDGKRTYTGSTCDLERRISEHNSGKNLSSRSYRPYILLVKYGFSDLSEARKKERFLKSTTGRRILKEIILQWQSNRV